MKVLIADDSMVMRNIIGKTIIEMGHEKIEAANGYEVLLQLAKYENRIGLILLDWNMPKMDGFEVLKRIKEHKRLGSIPVLMVSTESEEESVKRAMAAGATGYIPKPFSPEELATAIKATLEAR